MKDETTDITIKHSFLTSLIISVIDTVVCLFSDLENNLLRDFTDD